MELKTENIWSVQKLPEDGMPSGPEPYTASYSWAIKCCQCLKEKTTVSVFDDLGIRLTSEMCYT